MDMLTGSPSHLRRTLDADFIVVAVITTADGLDRQAVQRASRQLKEGHLANALAWMAPGAREQLIGVHFPLGAPVRHRSHFATDGRRFDSLCAPGQGCLSRAPDLVHLTAPSMDLDRDLCPHY